MLIAVFGPSQKAVLCASCIRLVTAISLVALTRHADDQYVKVGSPLVRIDLSIQDILGCRAGRIVCEICTELHLRLQLFAGLSRALSAGTRPTLS